MFDNYISVTLRSFIRNKVYVLINLLGLGIGFAAVMLITLFVKHETSYDATLPNVERLYRLAGTYHFPGREAVPVATFFGGAREMLIKDYPEIEAATSLREQNGSIIRGTDIFVEPLFYATPNFFDLFEIPFIEGNRQNALTNKLSIVLSRDMAEKHLGDGPWVGKTMTIRHVYERDVQITGVYENLPDNSHMAMDFILPHDEQVWGEGTQSRFNNWGFLGVYTYFILKPGASITPIENTLDSFVDRYVPERTQQSLGMTGSEIYEPRLHRVEDIHLEDYGQYPMKPPSSWGVIFGFIAIAIIIIAVASINFMNLATAMSTTREKEVAMRKVSGASTSQIFTQFQLEALFLCLLSLMVAYITSYLALPLFNSFAERNMDMSMLYTVPTTLAFIGLALIAGILGGGYPSLILSKLRPARILMSGRSSGGHVTKMRTLLVAFQFTASTALIISTLIIYFQTDHARTVDLGYERDHSFAVQGLTDADVLPMLETFKERVHNIAGVTATALSSFAPGDRDVSAIRATVPDNPQPAMIFYRSIDYDFFDLYKVSPIAGRLFHRDFGTDRIDPDAPEPTTEQPSISNMIINRSAVRMLGYETAEAAVDQIVTPAGGGNRFYKIIGVIPDVHLKTPTRPNIAEVYFFDPSQMTTLNISFEPRLAGDVREDIDTIWKEMFPRIPLTLMYVEDYVSEQFHDQVVLSNVMIAFTTIAVAVACIGLFGLTSFSSERRTKEIGLRKVLGARRVDILWLMLKQFSKPVIIANIIAWPFSWYFMSDWINSFHYRIDFLIYFAGVSALGLALTICIAFLTVSYHATRASGTKPVTALRHE